MCWYLGYGQQTPLSAPGKVFCMIYALLGIPLTLLLLSVSVERVMGPVNGLLSIMNNRMGHLYSAFHIRWLCILTKQGSNFVMIAMN